MVDVTVPSETLTVAPWQVVWRDGHVWIDGGLFDRQAEQALLALTGGHPTGRQRLGFRAGLVGAAGFELEPLLLAGPVGQIVERPQVPAGLVGWLFDWGSLVERSLIVRSRFTSHAMFRRWMVQWGRVVDGPFFDTSNPVVGEFDLSDLFVHYVTLLEPAVAGRGVLVRTVLSNPTLTAGQLRMFLDCRPHRSLDSVDLDVAVGVARHPNLWRWDVVRLARSARTEVRLAVAGRVGLPGWLSHRLADDPEPVVAQTARLMTAGHVRSQSGAGSVAGRPGW